MMARAAASMMTAAADASIIHATSHRRVASAASARPVAMLSSCGMAMMRSLASRRRRRPGDRDNHELDDRGDRRQQQWLAVRPGWPCRTGRRHREQASHHDHFELGGVHQHARRGPEASSSIASWIMVSSRWVSGLSNGSWPVSATATTANAAPARRRDGVYQADARGAAEGAMAPRSVETKPAPTPARANSERGLHERGDGYLAAAGDPAEGASGVERGERHNEATDGQQPHHDQQVTPATRAVDATDERDQPGGHQDDAPARGRRDCRQQTRDVALDRALGPPLGEIAIGLPEARATTVLEARLVRLVTPNSSGATSRVRATCANAKPIPTASINGPATGVRPAPRPSRPGRSAGFPIGDG